MAPVPETALYAFRFLYVAKQNQALLWSISEQMFAAK